MVGPHETERQRWQRNYRDLLQELRVAQIGVQIMFVFLLVLPFTARFETTTGTQRAVFVVALTFGAFAAAAVVAPVAFHRALFRRGRKPQLVALTHRMTAVGLGCMLVSLVAAVLLITLIVLPRPVALVVTTVTALWFLLLWAVLPVAWRHRGDDPGRELSVTEVTARIEASDDH